MRSTTQVRLGDIVDVVGGATPTTGNSAYWGGAIPWVSPKDMKVEEITGAIDTVTSEGVSAGRLKIVPPGSILIVTRGMILLHSVPVAITRRPVTINQDMKALMPRKGTNEEFLLRILQGAEDILLRCVSTAAHGTKKIDLEQLLNCVIPYGDDEFQRAITTILNQASSIQRLRDEARAKVREIIPALFAEMFGDPMTNPKGWSITTVSDVINAADYGTSSKASDQPVGTPILRMGNVSVSGGLQLESLKYLDAPKAELARFFLDRGDILFNRTNSKELVGKTGLWNGRFEAVAASYFIRIRLRQSVMLPTFFWAYFNSKYMKARLYETARGAIGQANINTKELKAFSIPVPPLPLQQEFADRVAEIESATALNDKAVATAEHLTQSLLAQVFGATACAKTPELCAP